MNGVLKSWALPKGPTLNTDERHLAVLVEDHPLDYRFFEGEIPEGQYGAGKVIIWDYGTYSPESKGVYYFDNRAAAEELMLKDLEKGKISIVLRGQKLKGSFTLVKIQKRDKDWLFIKHRDRYADKTNEILENERSIVSAKQTENTKLNSSNKTTVIDTLKQFDLSGANRTPFPSSFSPMLATLTDEPFDDKNWFFEPKLDGYRIISFINNKSVELKTRNGISVTSKYDLLVPELGQIPVSTCILDGEIIALDSKGKQCFQCLQNYLEAVRGSKTVSLNKLMYYVFDILYLDGYDLVNIPLQNRKQILNSILKSGNSVSTIEFFKESGKALYDAAIKNGLEGIMAKKKDSLYEVGKRSKYWLKIKGVLSSDFVVGGYTAGTGFRSNTFGALLLGYYKEPKKLIYAGNVGTGFNEKFLFSFKNILDKLKIENSSFTQPPESKSNVTWVRPEVVVEVKYSQVTKDGCLRTPVFLRLRTDKSASEVQGTDMVKIPLKDEKMSISSSDSKVGELLNQIKKSGESLSIEIERNKIFFDNLNKELWPAFKNRPSITKNGFISYLVEISSYILPHLKNRPLTFNRFPGGIYGEHFFQKHWNNPLPPYVETIKLHSEHKGGETEYMLCNNLSTLLWLGQIANLEIHSWFSRVTSEPDIKVKREPDDLADFPDYIIFDIDPFIYSGEEKKAKSQNLIRRLLKLSLR